MSNAKPAERTGSNIVEVTQVAGVLRATFMTSAVATRETPEAMDAIATAMTGMGSTLRELVLDTSRVSFINSMGLGMWIDLRNRAEQVGARTFLLGVQQHVSELLNTVKVDRLFALVPTEKALELAMKQR